MILIERDKLEKALKETLDIIWAGDTWLNIDSIRFDFDYEDEKDYTYTIIGRYGRESEEESLRFNKDFNLEFLDKEWSLDFIKGYFYEYMNAGGDI